ncbi:MAG: sulfatase-like hydrolase/transferase [Allosphingosinicella sp.]|uniref:sulfatase-like hydrolase/transferase n=1 Tax=Allosphingosinicella sp. TaxID=2823234 RepID=UPI00395C1319
MRMPNVALWGREPDAVRSLLNWLVCWLLLPNIGYWLLWLIGGPPRPTAIVLTGLLGVLTHRSPFWVKLTAFVGAMLFSALVFISALFNLSVGSLFYSLRFAAELNPSASLEYIVCAVAVLLTLVAAWRLLRRPTELVAARRWVIAVCAVFVTASADVAMSYGDRGSYKRIAPAGAPFTSAVSGSRLLDVADGERHLVLVMVEAMGQPADPALRRRLVDLWARPEVRERYEVVTGETLFYGSTTNGEVRELCGRWGDYPALIERADRRCLPGLLAARGYHTSAWHSFQGSFFDRLKWYPNIGFEEMRFAPELIRGGADVCPGVFPGACDRDVPRLIGERLKSAEAPEFLYWLTVNSHLPVVESEQLNTDHCARFDPAMAEDFPMACRLFQLFDETGRALAHEVTQPDFPATDIMIVGDHIPPFFDRQHRNLFEPDRVPWILLRARDTASADAADS